MAVDREFLVYSPALGPSGPRLRGADEVSRRCVAQMESISNSRQLATEGATLGSLRIALGLRSGMGFLLKRHRQFEHGSSATA